VAIQHQVIPTKNYRKVILKEGEIEDKCRRCSGKGETTQHLLNRRPSLAATAYKTRHDAAEKKLHQEIFRQMMKDKYIREYRTIYMTQEQ